MEDPRIPEETQLAGAVEQLLDRMWLRPIPVQGCSLRLRRAAIRPHGLVVTLAFAQPGPGG
eukprot:2174310-Lingulodinium_polyedra.AAC.1